MLILLDPIWHLVDTSLMLKPWLNPTIMENKCSSLLLVLVERSHNSFWITKRTIDAWKSKRRKYFDWSWICYGFNREEINLFLKAGDAKNQKLVWDYWFGWCSRYSVPENLPTNVAEADASEPLYSAIGPVALTLSTTEENFPVTCMVVFQ